jgi:hypothetical protein
MYMVPLQTDVKNNSAATEQPALVVAHLTLWAALQQLNTTAFLRKEYT